MGDLFELSNVFLEEFLNSRENQNFQKGIIYRRTPYNNVLADNGLSVFGSNHSCGKDKDNHTNDASLTRNDDLHSLFVRYSHRLRYQLLLRYCVWVSFFKAIETFFFLTVRILMSFERKNDRTIQGRKLPISL